MSFFLWCAFIVAGVAGAHSINEGLLAVAKSCLKIEAEPSSRQKNLLPPQGFSGF